MLCIGRNEIQQCKFPGTVQDILEASCFWHDNGEVMKISTFLNIFLCQLRNYIPSQSCHN